MTNLTVNGSFKEVGKQLDENVPIEEIKIKLKVSVPKPLHASWLMEAYNHLTSAAVRDIIANGWHSPEITKAVSEGIEGLENLDPFHLIDPLVQQSNKILDP